MILSPILFVIFYHYKPDFIIVPSDYKKKPLLKKSKGVYKK